MAFLFREAMRILGLEEKSVKLEKKRRHVDGQRSV